MPVTDVAATLTRCARSIGAPVRTSTTERSVRAVPQGFEIQANDDLLRAQAVVLATGACVLPATPAVADAPRPEPRAAADAIVLRQHRAVASSPFVLALVAFLPAVARGIIQRQPAAVAIFGALAALTIWLWVLVIRRCGHLDIAADAITLVTGRGRTVVLNRQQGDVLRVGGSASPQSGNTRYLTIQGTATRIPLALFKLSQVRQACTAKGWQFQ